jgi:hypothetical protein
MLDLGSSLGQDLVREDGFYRVRVPASLVNPRNSYVMASIKAVRLALVPSYLFGILYGKFS